MPTALRPVWISCSSTTIFALLNETMIDDGLPWRNGWYIPIDRVPCRTALVNPSIHLDPKIVTSRSEENTSELQSLMRISYAVFCLQTTTHNQYEQMHHTNNKSTKYT